MYAELILGSFQFFLEKEKTVPKITSERHVAPKSERKQRRDKKRR